MNEALLQTLRGFQDSRALLTGIELDIFNVIGDGATAADVAGRVQADPRGTEMLLNALAALGVLEKRDGVFRLTADGTELARDRMAYLHYVALWRRWSTLTDAVRAGGTVAAESQANRDPSWTEAFIAAMDRFARERAPEVVRAVDARTVSHMLDVGGGSAAYSIAFAQANPALRATVFDLGPVTEIAMRHIAAAGLGGRVEVQPGNFLQDDFGGGYDLALVSAICHMLGPHENVTLFVKCHAAVPAGGRIVVQDFLLDSGKTSPRQAALFSLNMLVGTARGASYSEDEYRAWLSAAGFTGIRRVDLSGPSSMLIGTR